MFGLDDEPLTDQVVDPIGQMRVASFSITRAKLGIKLPEDRAISLLAKAQGGSATVNGVLGWEEGF